MFPIEVNFMANIVMHIRHAKHFGIPVDGAFIEKQALLGVEYMKQIEGQAHKTWHAISFEKGEAK